MSLLKLIAIIITIIGIYFYQVSKKRTVTYRSKLTRWIDIVYMAYMVFFLLLVLAVKGEYVSIPQNALYWLGGVAILSLGIRVFVDIMNNKTNSVK